MKHEYGVIGTNLVWRLGKSMCVRLVTLSTVHYHQCVDYWQEEVKRVQKN